MDCNGGRLTGTTARKGSVYERDCERNSRAQGCCRAALVAMGVDRRRPGVPVLLPGTDGTVLEAALFLLELEGLEQKSVVWLHGTAVVPEPPPGFRAAIRVSRNAIDLEAQRLVRRLLESR